MDNLVKTIELSEMPMHALKEINKESDDTAIILKVPGGFIYRFWDLKTKYYSLNGIFVSESH